MCRTKRLVPVFVFLISLLFSSCRDIDAEYKISMDDTFYWALCNEESTIEDAPFAIYNHLENMEYHNLENLFGNEGQYIWLRARFKIPDELKDQNLSMVIPYLHFADELYLNNHFIDSYGFMGEQIQDAGYKAQIFDFPKEFLNQEDNNTIFIKVLVLGKATISDKIYITTRDEGWAYSDIRSFWQSLFYMLFEGALFASMVVFILFFITNTKEKGYLYFSLLCFCSIIFFSNFFLNDLPFVGFHGGISFLTSIKIVRGYSFYGMVYFFVYFVFAFMKLKHHIIEQILRHVSLVICIILTATAKDYVALMKVCPYIVFLLGIDVLLTVCYIIIKAFSPYAHERKYAFLLLITLSPLFLSFTIDAVVKLGLNDMQTFYFSLVGYQFSIFSIFVYFCVNYRKASARLEYLNTELENEVMIQTKQLTKANESLENEIATTRNDLRTAAVVQKKLFHLPEVQIEHWDIAVSYEPYSIVSGDLFNFYNVNDTLYGVSIFDTSGHGVAASLVTMLAENVIQQIFSEGYLFGEDVANTLSRINDRFIVSKGDIENYMTGLLLNLREFEDKKECVVSIANAGHPYPELYIAAENRVEEILPEIENAGVGPVGIEGIESHYSSIDFTMKENDILLLFTDGLTEAVNPNRLEFGRNKIEQILKDSKDDVADVILKKIKLAQKLHMGTAPMGDDTTIIVMKRK